MGERAAEKHPVRRTQEQRRTEAEQKLLQSAIELIAEQGGGPTSLAQIGDRAGFSRGIVNHHFGSRVASLDERTGLTRRRPRCRDTVPRGRPLGSSAQIAAPQMR